MFVIYNSDSVGGPEAATLKVQTRCFLLRGGLLDEGGGVYPLSHPVPDNLLNGERL